jgi:hypothetical protein
MKLREPAGFAINVQTPWAVGDLGDVMIQLNDQDPERPLAVRIDPVMTIKPEAARKPLLTLTEDDVILNFLPKLNWKFVRDEMRSPEGIGFFKTQYMTEWPPEEDEGLTVSFTEDEIRARIRSAGFFESPTSTVVMSLDRAFSVSRYADFSCIAVGKRFQRDTKTICGILDVKMERWKESDLVENLVLMISRYQPTMFVLEKDRGYENLVETVRKTLIHRGIPVPRIIAKDIPAGGKNLHSKARRIKLLELPLSDGRLWFAASALWNEILISQFVLFDGTKSNTSRKDDIPDAISLLYETFMPKVMSAQDPAPTDQQKIDKEVERQQEEERRRAMHDRMFLEQGQLSTYGVTTASQYDRRNDPPPELAPPRELTPRERGLAQLAKILPTGMRSRRF